MTSFLLKYLLLLCSLWAFIPSSFAQKEITDTVDAAKTGPAPKSDEIYFNAVKAKMKDDTRHAEELFEEFAKQRPEVSDAWYELAKIYDGEKNLDKAQDDIKKAIAIDDANKWYQEEYATILGDRRDYLAAAGVMAGLCKSAPEDPSYPIITAEYYERAQKYDEAIAYLDKALARNGPDEDILMRKVQLYLNNNKVDKAADVAQQLIDLDPRNGKYYKELGEIYDDNNMAAKAAIVYKKAEMALPGDASVQLGYAEHYLKTGDTTSYFLYIKKAVVNKGLDAGSQLELLKAYIQSLPNNDSELRVKGMPVIRELVAQHPNDADVLAFFGEFLDVGNEHDSAMIIYKRSLAITPGNYNLWERVLRNYAAPKDADSLIKYSEKALRLFPNQSVVHFFNGIGHNNKKEYPAAIKAIQRGINLQSDSNPQLLSEMYAQLADVYHTTKQDELSDAAFEKALELEPKDPYVLNNYSYYLSERGKKLAEAERMSKRSLELKPDQATFMDTYGWILYQNGDYPKAKEYIQKAIDMSGVNADGTLYDHLGNVYFKLKEKDKATESWKKAKEKGVDDPNIDKKISEGKLYE